jgi:hypothetical protein
MKIFIWEDVLRDWSQGMAVAYAETLEQALAEIAIEHDGVARALGAPTKVINCDTDKKTFFAYVYGGG